jgi:heat shock protein HslJ
LRRRATGSLGAVVAGLALIVAVAGCGSDSNSSSSGTSAANADTTVGGSKNTGTPLEGTNWTLTTGGGMGADLTPVGVTAKLEGGAVTGNGGCNQYNATYTLSGTSLTFGPVSSTSAACSGVQGTVETAYLALLPKVSSYYITGSTLTLSDSDAKPLLIYQAGA